MSKLAQQRELRNAKAKEANELYNKYPATEPMPAADVDKFDALCAEVAAIDADIKRADVANQLFTADNVTQEQILLNIHTKEPSKHNNTDESKAIRAYLGDGGIKNLNADQLGAMKARQTQEIRNAMSTTTAAEGGYTVATEYMRTVEALKKAYGGMRRVANIIQTASGATIPWPTSDATAEMGAILPQNTTTSRLDTTFGVVNLDAYMYTSLDIAIPFQLLQDSFIDIEAFINDILAVRLGRIQNLHFTTGSGTAQPRGIQTGAAAGRIGAAGTTLTVTYDDLVRLEHAIDPAYRDMPGVGYMMHDSSVMQLRLIKDAQNRPIFVPGYEAGAMIDGGAPDRLMGRPIYINQDMPVMAANAKSILFGALNKYVIRDVMDLTLFRMTDSAFTRNAQVGFLALQRSGGNLIDVGGNTTKYFQNSAT